MPYQILENTVFQHIRIINRLHPENMDAVKKAREAQLMQMRQLQEEFAMTCVITGVMASGKSTVDELLAKGFPKSVQLHGDIFRKMIACGR